MAKKTVIYKVLAPSLVVGNGIFWTINSDRSLTGGWSPSTKKNAKTPPATRSPKLNETLQVQHLPVVHRSVVSSKGLGKEGGKTMGFLPWKFGVVLTREFLWIYQNSREHPGIVKPFKAESPRTCILAGRSKEFPRRGLQKHPGGIVGWRTKENGDFFSTWLRDFSKRSDTSSDCPIQLAEIRRSPPEIYETKIVSEAQVVEATSVLLTTVHGRYPPPVMYETLYQMG